MTLIHDSSGKGVGLENPLPTKVIESTIMQPVDIQSRYQQTIQTHNAVSVGASGFSVSSYMDANGFSDVAINFKNDASTASTVDLYWSTDGVTDHGYEALLPTASVTLRSGITATKARYFKIVVNNGDAIAHVMSAWAYLKA